MGIRPTKLVGNYIGGHNHEDLILAYRTKGEYWGKQRAVVVTYNPTTARKQNYNFESKFETIRQELLMMRK